MIDSIGLGGFFASTFFWFFILAALIVGIIFYRLNKYASLVLSSILLNIAFLNYQSNIVVVQILLIILWPGVNLLLLTYGVVRLFQRFLVVRNEK